MLERATSCIAVMKRRINKEKLQILTGVAALFILPKSSGMFASSCKLLRLNSKSKYVLNGLENRLAYDNFLKLDGNIQVGEMVVCRDG